MYHTSFLVRVANALSIRNPNRKGSISKRKSRRHDQANDDQTVCTSSDSESSPARDAIPVDNAASRLPSASYYSSNHVLVNRARAKRGLNGLFRSRFLDAMAREKARQLAGQTSLEGTPHTVLVQTLRPKEAGTAMVLVGENISRGRSIRSMHKHGKEFPSHKKNMFNRYYNEMGMGTAVCEATGTLYMVQYFRFNPEQAPEYWV